MYLFFVLTEQAMYKIKGERLMLKEILKEKDYLNILTMNDGSNVTKDKWPERRKELVELLEQYSYGKTPKIPVKVWGQAVSLNENNSSYAGKVRTERVKIFMQTEKGIFSFPISIFIPKNVEKPPVFLHVSFYPVPDILRYNDVFNPVEEITDAGYALVVVCYTDIMNDNFDGDFFGGLAAYFGMGKNREGDEWGKIGMWAYAASRVLDYIISEREDLDSSKVAIIGHSRLGKVALWCGAQDERFAAVISNNSGHGGAASARHWKGKEVEAFINAGSWEWFCENFKKFSDGLEENFDQSFLLALVAPRLLCVGSAVLDTDSSPESEFLTSLHASQVWNLLGEKGLVCPDRMPVAGDHFMDGNISYHLRANHHFLSREDWNMYIKFLNEKYKTEKRN